MQLISWATLQGSLELGIIYAIMALGVLFHSERLICLILQWTAVSHWVLLYQPYW